MQYVSYFNCEVSRILHSQSYTTLWQLNADAVVQNVFVKQYLARQPTLKFNKTKKLLHMSKPAQKRNKLISLEDAAPAAVRPAASSVGKRRRSSYKPVRRQPAGRI